MGLDVNAKHGIIIGYFTAVLTLPYIIYKLPMLDDMRGVENYMRVEYTDMAIMLIAGISGCLMIFGIFKNQPSLLVPWLASEIIFSANLVFNPGFNLKAHQLILLLLGLQFLLFYPICNLCVAMGRRKAALSAQARH